MPDFLRPYLSRILAPIIVWFVGWIAAKYGIVVTPDQVSAMSELLIAIILIGITHKAIDSKINPHDVASKIAAAETKGAL